MRPIRPTAEEVFSDLAIVALVLAMFVICSTMENVAICWVDSLASIGDEGSWCWSWATNSFRKPSLSSVALRWTTAVEPDRVPVPTVPVVAAAALVLT